MQVFILNFYYEQHSWPRSYLGPKDFDRLRQYIPPLTDTSLFCFFYLSLHPNKYENENLRILEKYSDTRCDVEHIGDWVRWCSSEKFKIFCEQENLAFDFYPVKVEGERRYLTMWRRLPVIGDLEIDHRRSDIASRYVDFDRAVFRSDILEYFNHQIFCEKTFHDIFITDQLKKKFEENGFLFSYAEREVTQVKLKEKKVKKELEKLWQLEKKKRFNEYYFENTEKVDQILEKVLIDEGDEKVLEKFRREIKGAWKKQFEDFKAGKLPEDEPIIYV